MGFEYGKVNRDKVANADDSKLLEFRPKTGTSQVRVLPPHKTSSIWFFKSNEHWVDGVGYVPCPRQFGKPCPICEEGERLFGSEDENKVKQALELRPREQYYYNVLVFTSGDGKVTPKDGVRIMRTGVKVFKQLRGLDNDEAGGWGDMTNPETGFNVSIARAGAGRTDTEYTVTPVPNRNQTLEQMLSGHGVTLDSLNLFNLEDYVKSLRLEYDDLKSKFENKQVAPGFPGGPRLAAPQVVGTVVPPQKEEVPFTLTNDDGVVAPPTIEE